MLQSLNISPISVYEVIEPPGDTHVKNQLEGNLKLIMPGGKSQDWLIAISQGHNDRLNAAIVNYVRMRWNRKFKSPVRLPYGYLGETNCYGKLLKELELICVDASKYCYSNRVVIHHWTLFNELLTYLRAYTLPIAILSIYECELNSKTAKQATAKLKKQCTRLNNLEAPKSDNLNIISAVFLASILIAEKNDVFRAERHRSCIRAMRDAIDEMDSNWELGRVENGQLYRMKYGRNRLKHVPVQISTA